VLNFTPVPRQDYRLGIPQGGYWRELLNSDAEMYGGSNLGNGGGVTSEPIPAHGRDSSINLVVPPLGAVFLKRQS
jgi:1,4-alpha-glucan branching enzyme